MVQLQFMIVKWTPDFLTLSKTLHDVSVSRNRFLMSEIRQFGASETDELTHLFPLSDKRLVPTNRHGGGFLTLNSYYEAQRGRRTKRYKPGYRGNVFLFGNRFSFSVNLNHRKWLTKNRSTNWNFRRRNPTFFHLI